MKNHWLDKKEDNAIQISEAFLEEFKRRILAEVREMLEMKAAVEKKQKLEVIPDLSCGLPRPGDPYPIQITEDLDGMLTVTEPKIDSDEHIHITMETGIIFDKKVKKKKAQ